MIDGRPVVGIPVRLPPGRDGATTGPLDVIQDLSDRVVRLVREAGAEPVLIDERLEGLDACDAFVVPGGGDVVPDRYSASDDDPTLSGMSEAQDELDVTVLRVALDTGRPVLGICRGMQLLNVVTGGTLHPDLAESTVVHRNPPDVAFAFAVHDVEVLPGTRCAAAYGDGVRIPVASGHHQAVATVGEGLRASAVAEDGLVEALESADDRSWVLGVQWHPEADESADELRLPLFRALASAATGIS